MLKKVIAAITSPFAKALSWLSTTRFNYWAEYVLDLSLVGLLAFEGAKRHSGGPLMILLPIGIGLVGFSFTEYCFHRWLFHTRIPLFEEGHRMHHENPMGYDALPFFLPGILSLGLAAFFSLFLPLSFVFLMMSAVTAGYVFYGFSHFIIHHVRFRNPVLMRWAASHHIHHHHPDKNYGVTTPFWDIVLQTRYQRQSQGG